MRDKPTNKRENEESKIEKHAKRLCCDDKKIIEKNIDIDDYLNQPLTSGGTENLSLMENVNFRREIKAEKTNDESNFPDKIFSLCVMIDDDIDNKQNPSLDPFNNPELISNDSFFKLMENDFQGETIGVQMSLKIRKRREIFFGTPAITVMTIMKKTIHLICH